MHWKVLVIHSASEPDPRCLCLMNFERGEIANAARRILEYRHTFWVSNHSYFPRLESCFRLSQSQDALILSISQSCPVFPLSL